MQQLISTANSVSMGHQQRAVGRIGVLHQASRGPAADAVRELRIAGHPHFQARGGLRRFGADHTTTSVGTAPRVADSSRGWPRPGTSSRPPGTRSSFAVEGTLRPDRLVLGFNTTHSWAEAILRRAFGQIIESGTPTIVTDWATVELAKRAANFFLATEISFINAMAEVCEKSDANVTELA
ncbi:hypothetical protein NRF20_42540 [Streptomyces sp. R-74717]|uniref:hypothetical protein n=1 Tax=Streptomyces sp. R-74717 TaxID=2969820 RepID=UPI0039B451AA